MAETKEYWSTLASHELKMAQKLRKECWGGLHRYDATMKLIAEGVPDEEIIERIGLYRKGASGKLTKDRKTLETYKKVYRGEISEGHDDMEWPQLMRSIMRY